MPARGPGAPPAPPAKPEPADDLLPLSATPAALPKPKPNTPAAADEFLPIPPPQPVEKRVAPSATRAWRIDKKLVMIGAGVFLLIVAGVFVWSKTGDDVQGAIRTPASEVDAATSAAAGVELQTAMQAANVLYLDVGSYTNVNPATLKSVEPSLVYVAGEVAAAPGEVSVFVKDAQSIVLVTTKPDGTCRALYQSQIRTPGARASGAVRGGRACNSAEPGSRRRRTASRVRARAWCRTSRTPARPNPRRPATSAPELRSEARI